MSDEVKIIPYEVWHGESIINGHSLSGIKINASDYTANIKFPDMAWTGINDQVVLGCCGIVPLWNGVGEAWTMLSLNARDSFGLTLHRAVKNQLYEIAKKKSLHRVHCHVLENFEAGHRWAKCLGFTYEGIMKWYGPNKETFARYGIIFE